MNAQLEINQEYEIGGYPHPFPDRFIGKFIGCNEGQNYFVREIDSKKVFVTTPAHFTEVNGNQVCVSSLSSFGAGRFILDQLDKKAHSHLLIILKELGEEI